MNNELVAQINSLQKQVDGLIKPETGRWLDWTPTVTQNGAVAATVSYAKYMVLNELVIAHAALTITGAGTGGNAIQVDGIPYGSAQALDFAIGHGFILDSGIPQLYIVEVVANTATSWRFLGDAVGANYVGITPNFALANQDAIRFTCTYKKA